MSEPGSLAYKKVDTTFSCTMTRFRVRSAFGVLRLYILFRRVEKQAKGIDGLFKALFLVEGWRVCYTVSFWRDSRAILEFNSHIDSHVRAANFSMSQLQRTDTGPVLWSARFQLCAISPHNIRWEDVEFTDGQGHKFSEDVSL